MVELFNDDFGLRGAIPYIYTKKDNNKFNWFIMHWKTEQRAKDNCPQGYTVNRYTTTQQMRG